MLAELDRKLRGVGRWPQTTATVTATSVYSDGGYRQPPPSVSISFYYHDQTGSIQGGNLIADNLTSLYDLKIDDTFAIRYNPRRPAQFYCDEVSSAFTAMHAVALSIVGLLVALAMVLAIRLALGHH
jgi:hypothetical protein